MKKNLIFIVSLGLALAINIYFRTFTIHFPQLKIQAKYNVEQKIQQEAVQEINKKFPEFSDFAKNNLIKAYVKEYKKNNQRLLKKQIQEEYARLKEPFQDEQGQTYLMELDCWHWARYVENVLQFGHPADKVVNGKQLDSFMLAPLGSYLPWNHFLFYLSALLYKIFYLFKPIPLFSFLFYLPLFFITIFIIVLYLFAYKHGGNLVALVSCFYVGLAPVFLPRSIAGWFDMDILNLLFFLLIIWTYLSAINAESLRHRLLWVCFSAFLLGLFSYTWVAWWFALFVILLYGIYSLLNSLFIYWQYKEKNLVVFKKHIFSLIFFTSFAFFWIIIFSGLAPLKNLFTQIKNAIFINKALSDSIWPNVFTHVQELQKVAIEDVFTLTTGGLIISIFSVVSMLLLYLRAFSKREDIFFRRESIIILIIWFFSMFFACTKAIRFSIFLLIPMGICLGCLINDAYEYFKKRKKIWGICIVVLAVIVLSTIFMDKANNAAKRIYPFMDDFWYKTLIRLKETTPQEAILNSWWDFGDFFKVVAKRRVIFDGQSQNTPQASWISRVLLTDNETEAMGILRMLNNAGNQAFEVINEYLKDPFKSIMLLKKVTQSDKKNAEEAILKLLPTAVRGEVIKLVFDKPVKAYFIVDYSMKFKTRVLSYFGNWDFSRAYIIQNLKRREKRQIVNYLIELGIDEQKAERLYQEASLIPAYNLEEWISQRFNFHSDLVNGKEEKNIVYFDNGFIYNIKEGTFYIYFSRERKYKIPKSLFVFENDNLKEISYPQSDLDSSALVIKTKENFQAVLLNRQLVNSIFLRLYFLNGFGLKHFKPFIEEKEKDRIIKIFEMVWD